MTLTTEEIVDILIDDEKYVRHVNTHLLSNDAQVRILEIPKSSFTAFRLSYASPVELSLSSKVVLLGGIPAGWYQAQKDTIRRGPSKSKTSEIQGRVNRLTRYGLKAVYNSEKIVEERIPGQFFEDGQYDRGANSSSYDGEANRGPKHSSTCVSDGKLQSNKDKQKLVFSPTVNLHQVPLRYGKDKRVGFGKSSEDLPMASPPDKEILGWFLGQIGKEDVGDEQTDVNHEGGKKHGFSAENVIDGYEQSRTASWESSSNFRKRFNGTFSGEEVVVPHRDQQQNVDQLYREQERNEVEMDKLLNGVASPQNQESGSTDTYVSAASEVKEARRFGKRDHKSTNPANSSPGISTLSDADVPRQLDPSDGADDKRQNNLNFRQRSHLSHRDGLSVDTLDTQKSAQGLRKSAKVLKKPKTLSKSYKRLSLIPPKPEADPFDGSGKPVESDKSSIPKVHKYNLESFNDKREGIGTRLRKSFSKRYGSYSSYVRPDRMGPIVLMDKILVLVKDAVSQRNPIREFSEAEPIDTRIACRWREYLVVARLTNRDDHPVLIQFCHHKHFSHFHSNTCHCNEHGDDPGSGNTLDFYLNKNCIVGVYSILDKTLFVEKPDDKLDYHTLEELYDLKNSRLSTLKFYIFRCSTLASTSKWYDFLQSVVGVSTIHNKISLKVPEAGVSFTLRLNRDVLERLTQAEAREEHTLKISYLPRGYHVFQIPILRYISVAVNEKLREAGYEKVVKEWEGANVNLGCNFRHYDLINWCSGQQGTFIRSMCALFQSYVLEFRPYTYYGRSLILPDGSSMTEPSPVEGFLIRLTNSKGLDRGILGKPYLKPAYFFTSENLLFRMGSNTSTPPVPLELLMCAKNRFDVDQINLKLNGLPDVYEQNPYPLDLESHIEWLKGNLNDDMFAFRDYYAFKCFSRRITQILKSESLVDMTEIEDVYQGTEDDIKSHEINYKVYDHTRSIFWEVDRSLNETAQSIIFIRIKEGCIIKLLALNPTISREWVGRLKALVQYWKEKQTSDLKKLWGIKMQNINNLKIEEVEEANINGRTPKWVTQRGVTDPSLYNVNALSVLRPILQRGVLYHKPKKHSVFSKYWVVLIPGFLILYHSFRRSKTGYAKSSVDHTHYMTIPIEECYVYSGTLTELDLLNRDRTFDEFNPGSHSLPRIYDDGWSSSETETSRCFTLWFGKKKVLSKSSRNLQKDPDHGNNSPHIPDLKNEPAGSNEQNPNMIRMLGQLGVSGNSMVFMARSRQERDLWVLPLYYELERLKNIMG